MAKFAILFPNRPGRPKYNWWFEGNISLAFHVDKNGILDLFKKDINFFSALFMWTPLPIKIKGRFELLIILINLVILSLLIFVSFFLVSNFFLFFCLVNFLDWISRGISIHTGPGLPSLATSTALDSSNSISEYLFKTLLYFVIGFINSWIFASWIPIYLVFEFAIKSLVSTCPDKTIIGIESIQAPITPVIAFVPPGPDVTDKIAGFFLTL